MERITVFLADDNLIVREGVRALLGIEPDLEVVGVAADYDELVAGAAAALSGLASWTMGDIAAACASYATAIPALTRAGHLADVLGCSIATADMQLRLGLLRDAERTFAHALEQHAPRFRRCNQDDLGNRQRVEASARACLREGLSMCIDRTNFDAR